MTPGTVACFDHWVCLRHVMECLLKNIQDWMQVRKSHWFQLISQWNYSFCTICTGYHKLEGILASPLKICPSNEQPWLPGQDVRTSLREVRSDLDEQRESLKLLQDVAALMALWMGQGECSQIASSIIRSKRQWKFWKRWMIDLLRSSKSWKIWPCTCIRTWTSPKTWARHVKYWQICKRPGVFSVQVVKGSLPVCCSWTAFWESEKPWTWLPVKMQRRGSSCSKLPPWFLRALGSGLFFAGTSVRSSSLLRRRRGVGIKTQWRSWEKAMRTHQAASTKRICYMCAGWRRRPCN